jgi:hypothetical protein
MEQVTVAVPLHTCIRKVLGSGDTHYFNRLFSYVPPSRPRPLPSKSSLIHHTSAIAMLMKELLNNPNKSPVTGSRYFRSAFRTSSERSFCLSTVTDCSLRALRSRPASESQSACGRPFRSALLTTSATATLAPPY